MYVRNPPPPPPSQNPSLPSIVLFSQVYRKNRVADLTAGPGAYLEPEAAEAALIGAGPSRSDEQQSLHGNGNTSSVGGSAGGGRQDRGAAGGDDDDSDGGDTFGDTSVTVNRTAKTEARQEEEAKNFPAVAASGINSHPDNNVRHTTQSNKESSTATSTSTDATTEAPSSASTFAKRSPLATATAMEVDGEDVQTSNSVKGEGAGEAPSLGMAGRPSDIKYDPAGGAGSALESGNGGGGGVAKRERDANEEDEDEEDEGDIEVDDDEDGGRQRQLQVRHDELQVRHDEQ